MTDSRNIRSAQRRSDGYKPNSASGMQDLNVLSELTEVYQFLEYGNRWDMEHFEQAMDYYVGKQWTDDEMDMLQNEGRPPLSLNLIFGKVNTVAGLEQQIRSGFKATPIGAEDDELAMLATALLKWEDRNKQLQKVFSRAFKTAIQCGRAWIDVSVAPIMGEVTMSNRVKNESVFNVY